MIGREGGSRELTQMDGWSSVRFSLQNWVNFADSATSV